MAGRDDERCRWHLVRWTCPPQKRSLSDPAGLPAQWIQDRPRPSLRTARARLGLVLANSPPAPTDKGQQATLLPHTPAAAPLNPNFQPPLLVQDLLHSSSTLTPEAASQLRRRALERPRGPPSHLLPKQLPWPALRTAQVLVRARRRVR